jgi:hypothetical protein
MRGEALGEVDATECPEDVMMGEAIEVAEESKARGSGVLVLQKAAQKTEVHEGLMMQGLVTGSESGGLSHCAYASNSELGGEKRLGRVGKARVLSPESITKRRSSSVEEMPRYSVKRRGKIGWKKPRLKGVENPDFEGEQVGWRRVELVWKLERRTDIVPRFVFEVYLAGFCFALSIRSFFCPPEASRGFQQLSVITAAQDR